MTVADECPTPHCHRAQWHPGGCEYGPYLAVNGTAFVGPGGVCDICGEDWPVDD